jgi:hypothetical protein
MLTKLQPNVFRRQQQSPHKDRGAMQKPRSGRFRHLWPGDHTGNTPQAVP